jgi:hypothetical protein
MKVLRSTGRDLLFALVGLGTIKRRGGLSLSSTSQKNLHIGLAISKTTGTPLLVASTRTTEFEAQRDKVTEVGGSDRGQRRAPSG